MAIQRLDHVNIVTRQLPEMITWYEDILGLSLGERPDFPFPGAWLYAGENAVVHLVVLEDAPRVGSEVRLKLEHFALTATDLPAFEATLAKHNCSFEKMEVPGVDIVQFHVADPDGNHIHIDFDTSVPAP